MKKSEIKVGVEYAVSYQRKANLEDYETWYVHKVVFNDTTVYERVFRKGTAFARTVHFMKGVRISSDGTTENDYEVSTREVISTYADWENAKEAAKASQNKEVENLLKTWGDTKLSEVPSNIIKLFSEALKASK